MKQRNYNIDKTPISDSEINKFKDFDSVLDKVNNGPINPEGNQNFDLSNLLKLGKNFLIAASAVTAAWFGFNKLTDGNIENKESSVTTITQEVKYSIRPPIKGADVAYESFEINAQEDIIITTSNESTYEIKRNSFRTQEGEVVRGEMVVKIREFHDPISVFRSGIPMSYDSAGIQYTFESAGMFQMVAEQNGVALSSVLDNPIKVDLASGNGSDEFNNYYFDTDKGEWEYLEKSQVVKLMDSVSSHEEIVMDELYNIDLLHEPVKPEPIGFPKVLQNKYAFTVDFDRTKFPELSSDVVFQVDETISDFSAMYYDVNWESVELERSTNDNRYTAHLNKGSTQLEVECFSALPVDVYAKLKAEYDASVKKYHADYLVYTNSQKVIQEQRIIEESRFNKALRKTEGQTKEKLVSNKRFRRRFSVTRLGGFNADHPMPPISISYSYLGDFSEKVTAKLRLDRKVLRPMSLSNIVGDRNLVLNRGKLGEVAYSKEQTNIMWALLPGERIAIANSEDFNEIDGKEHLFHMTAYDGLEGLEILEEMFAEAE
ncbi:MAG: hypothetical protein COA58_02295 [Bacteroidetes bacterium]|nr:MAG: hypothetical protein COA58_02295 [Bacteroidota bacterium]